MINIIISIQSCVTSRRSDTFKKRVYCKVPTVRQSYSSVLISNLPVWKPISRIGTGVSSYHLISLIFNLIFYDEVECSTSYHSMVCIREPKPEVRPRVGSVLWVFVKDWQRYVLAIYSRDETCGRSLNINNTTTTTTTNNNNNNSSKDFPIYDAFPSPKLSLSTCLCL